MRLRLAYTYGPPNGVVGGAGVAVITPLAAPYRPDMRRLCAGHRADTGGMGAGDASYTRLGVSHLFRPVRTATTPSPNIASALLRRCTPL